ncbi:TraV family lipoprotein, partial [Citrobacter portucalensis]
VLTGCYILPFHNDFACNLEDGYGKCISSDDAYTEATTGADMGHASTEDGVENDPKVSSDNSSANPYATQKKTTSAYSNYSERVYPQTEK